MNRFAFKRADRVKEVLRQEVSQIIHHELKDPRLGFLTVTDIKISDDLRNVKFFISVYGNEKNKRDSRIGLEKAKSYIRREIGKRVKLRYCPEINFVMDETSEHAANIDKIFMQIEKERMPLERD